MKTTTICAAALAFSLLAACNDRGDADDRAEDRMEQAAEASAAAAGPAEAALGLSERQLLDADLVGPDGVELGDVQAVLRGADGKVDRLLVEIEDSHPDKYVHVPVAGLKVVQQGADRDISTTMTQQQLAALPAVSLPAAAPVGAASGAR